MSSNYYRKNEIWLNLVTPDTGSNLMNLAVFGIALIAVGAGVKYLLRKK